MEEKRKHKRLELDVTVELERLDEDGITTLKYMHVDVTDVSRSGVGFISRKNWKLEVLTMPKSRFGRRKLSMQSSKSCVRKSARTGNTNTVRPLSE